MSKNYLSEMDYVSDCCGVPPRGNGDSDTSDIGICPECGDHCEYVDYSEEEPELTDEQKADAGSTANEQTDDLGFQEFIKTN
jgi:hypothetical protein